MSKRGSKLQEFVAHASSSVNCLSIGKKSRRVFVTGGDDRKVNLWAVGKTTPLLCLSGHTSPVKSVTYDSEEVLVVAGASSGTIKLWDLEQSKIVRTLTGHRAKCSSVEFHPFGEFFASGSSDTDLKIWDIRKKACIHTYNGHSRGITTIRFTPDGRWVVSCGEDNVVKVWDLTAGRLLHDFKSHGVVQCIDFHPHEFLMATGSADRVVQFWDLETFELIGSSGSEASGVRSVTFHPDGRTLFCGLDESLKVFSWEPIRCHDAVDMGWSHLGDLCIHEGQLLGCSYHQSRVAIWIADISLIGPYASGVIPRSNNNMDPESNNGENPPVAHLGTGMICNISAATLHKNKTEEITKIPHLTSSKSTRSVPLRDDSVHRVSPANSVGSQMSKSIEDDHCNGQGVELSLSAKLQRSGSLTSKDHLVNGHIRRNRQAITRPVAGPVVHRDSLESRNTLSYKNEAASAKTVAPVTPPKPTHMRKLSLTNGGTGVQTVRTKSESLNSTTNALDAGLRPNFLSRSMVNTETIESAEGHHVSIKNAAEKIERIQSTDPPLSFRHENYVKPTLSMADVKPTLSSEQPSPVKYVKGVAVVQGRTRSLVESWERRERCKSSEAVAFSSPDNTILESVNMPSTVRGCLQTSERSGTDSEHGIQIVMQNHESFLSVLKSRFTKLQVVRHFWEQSGVKGAITAVEKLPDHAVQVDLISILMENIDTISLDVFTCLLPLLRGLLDSNIERHINVSLEMLLKLVKIFGPVISSTTSASSVVGVDLQAERRRDLCNQCFAQLQNMKKILQSLIRRGGSLERLGLELNLVLQGL